MSTLVFLHLTKSARALQDFFSRLWWGKGRNTEEGNFTPFSTRTISKNRNISTLLIMNFYWFQNFQVFAHFTTLSCDMQKSNQNEIRIGFPNAVNFLHLFWQNSGIEKAFLFDVMSKIYIATDSSPVDMQCYELCCDVIDLVIDMSGIYGWVLVTLIPSLFCPRSPSVCEIHALFCPRMLTLQ